MKFTLFRLPEMSEKLDMTHLGHYRAYNVANKLNPFDNVMCIRSIQETTDYRAVCGRTSSVCR